MRRGPFIKYHELLAFLEPPEDRRERADVHRHGGDVQKMRKQPANLAVKHANELASLWDSDAEQLFSCKTVRMLLVHQRDIVEPEQYVQCTKKVSQPAGGG